MPDAVLCVPRAILSWPDAVVVLPAAIEFAPEAVVASPKGGPVAASAVKSPPPSEQHAADQGSAENGYDFLGAGLAVAPGNLGDDDVSVLDFAPDDFVNVIHDNPSPSNYFFSC